jgi:hypothetical protein
MTLQVPSKLAICKRRLTKVHERLWGSTRWRPSTETRGRKKAETMSSIELASLSRRATKKPKKIGNVLDSSDHLVREAGW